jgi:isopentenyl-diphosphate delta-isomerase
MVEKVDADGKIGLPVSIIEAHRFAISHRAISILIWNPPRTKMLLTRRASTKLTWPNYWSNAVCSHPLPGETYEAAAARRLFEELRVHSEVTPSFELFYGPVRCTHSGLFEHEYDHVFESSLPETTSFNPNSEEISACRWATLKDILALKAAGELTPWFEMIVARLRWSDDEMRYAGLDSPSVAQSAVHGLLPRK